MRIAIDIGLMSEERSGGGNYLFNLVKYLAEIDKVNRYIGYGFFFKSFDSKLSRIEFPRQRNFDLRIKRFPACLLNFSYSYFGYNLESMISRVDVVHCLGSSVPRVRTARLLVTIFDLIPLLFRDFHTSCGRREGQKQARRAAERAERIITISNSSKMDIIRLLHVPAEKIVVIPLAAGALYRRINDSEKMKRFKEKYNLRREYILYVGTLEPRKNIVNLLRAYSRLIREHADVKEQLIIIGKKGWLYADIFKEVKKLKLENRVIFTGYVPDEDIVLFYNCAGLFIYPSLYEGFGLPVLEAMACGTPVITSNRSSLPEIAGDASKLIDPENGEEIAQALYEVLIDDRLRLQMSEKGLERAKLFCWEKTAQRTLKVYEEMGKT
ncbi:MAG: glycosyltransferase family 4 protein [Nitrospirae bacterium]|nr:glycosyltransferase family 4 protein [Nitrospirota bacterium]